MKTLFSFVFILSAVLSSYTSTTEPITISATVEHGTIIRPLIVNVQNTSNTVITITAVSANLTGEHGTIIRPLLTGEHGTIIRPLMTNEELELNENIIEGTESILIEVTYTIGTGKNSTTQSATHTLKVENKTLVVNTFPNPATENITFDFSEQLNQSATLQLIDITGKIVLETTIEGDYILNIADLPKSMYQYIIYNDEINHTGKVVISK